MFELLVDGTPWVGPIRDLPSVGALKTVLAAPCGGKGAFNPGPHDLEVRGWIGDRSTALSAARIHIDLSCPSAAPETAAAAEPNAVCSTGSGSGGA